MTTLDERLHDAEAALGEGPRVAPPFDALRRRHRQRRRHSMTVGAAALSIVVVCVAVALAVRRGNTESTVPAAPTTVAVGPTTASVATTTTNTTKAAAGVQPLEGMPRLAASAVHTVHLSRNISVGSAVLDRGQLWFIASGTGCTGSCPWLFHADPSTGAVTGILTPPLTTQGAGPIAIGDGAAFVVTFNYDGSPLHVMRVDLGTGATAWTASIAGTSVQGNPRARLAFGDGGVWLSEGNLPVVELDPRTGSVLATITLPQNGAETNGEVRTVVDRFGLWLVGGNSGTTLMLVDPATQRANAVTSFGSGFTQSLAADDTYVWMTHYSGNPARLDLARVDLAHPGVSAAAGIPTAQVAVGDGEVWFLGYVPAKKADAAANHPGVVGRIDPKTMKVIGVTDLGFGSASLNPQLFVARGSAWVYDSNTQTITRITTP